ncbi:hypothetical protein M413DRAFT_12410 [Hebeloma cylindrosporum]|uniref:Uncharacterized protein n=1 Tax=Hebeloma cylindrosporum TaxID=76867 RepID=A0A0C2XN76_HEBCY|nr:hypothetical protein M413DRAFT_12410 [Hebeloma cylindrosporum h7]
MALKSAQSGVMSRLDLLEHTTEENERVMEGYAELRGGWRTTNNDPASFSTPLEVGSGHAVTRYIGSHGKYGALPKESSGVTSKVVRHWTLFPQGLLRLSLCDGAWMPNFCEGT